MKAKLVHDTGRQRWYELSEPIRKGICDVSGEVDIVKDMQDCCQRHIKKEFLDAVLEQYKDGCRMVVVSDAFTHIERLVFPGFRLNGNWSFIEANIDGKHTFMIDGGNPEAVYADEVYLRHLCILNHLKWEGVE